MITILGHDPGITNAGFAVVSFRPDPRGHKFPCQYKIRQVGILENTLSDLKVNPRKQLVEYGNELLALVKKYKAKHLIAERFMIRSFRTATAEYVSWMLGSLDTRLEYETKINTTAIPAVTWKNAVKRIFDLDAFYKSTHAFPHEIDSVLLAFYQAGQLNLLQTAKSRKVLKCKIETVSTRPAKRIPKKKTGPVKRKTRVKASPRKKAAPKRKPAKKKSR